MVAIVLLRVSRFLPALILLAGLLPSAWLLYRFRDTPQLGVAGDDIMYIGTAQSVIQGSYREPALPGNLWQTKFPPGYPVMLAAILKFKPAALAHCALLDLACGGLLHARMGHAASRFKPGASRRCCCTLDGQSGVSGRRNHGAR
jgi:hypothetical protein